MKSWVRTPFHGRLSVSGRHRLSEAHVQAERPIGWRWRRLEVADDPCRTLEVVRLGVDATESGGLPEVSDRDREARARGPEGSSPRVRQLVRSGGLPQSDKRRLLDEPPLRARWRLPQRHHPCLLPQGCLRVHQALAVEARLAADPLGAVELVVAALVVEQPLDPQPLVEQVESWDIDRFPARVRIPHEHRTILYRDLVGGDDAVTVRVVERIGPLPPPVDRIPLYLTRRGADDRWQAAHIRDEVGVVGGVDGQIEAEGRLVDDV